MYGMLLATLLSADNAVLSADISEDIQELKKSVQEIKKAQDQARVDELRQTITRLRQHAVEEKLDALRRDIQNLRNEELVYARDPLLPPMLHGRPLSQRAWISLQVPSGAAVAVNDKEINLPAGDWSLVSPSLEGGRDYFYDFKVTLVQDGKSIVRVKRVTVRPGSVVRISYENMDVANLRVE